MNYKEQIEKMLPNQDCDVCNGTGGWMSDTFSTAAVKWVVCDKCHGLPNTKLLESIYSLFNQEITMSKLKERERVKEIAKRTTFGHYEPKVGTIIAMDYYMFLRKLDKLLEKK